jgi:epoxyqueuosine reductase
MAEFNGRSRGYIDNGVYRRFDRRMTVFHRRNIYTGFDSYSPEEFDPGDPELLELAEARAAWTLHDNYSGAFRDSMLNDRDLVRGIDPFVYRFSSATEAAANVSSVARRFGASLVGITRIDQNWLYSLERNGCPVLLPDEADWAIVMAVEMDGELISTSPSLSAAAESGRGYSRMASLAGAVGEYLRLLGYYARSCGNDTAISIPLAVDAGLGIMGRNGLLLTREYGPRVRLCKVITDLELVQSESEYPDPETVCSDCTLCAEACEADALSRSPRPRWETLTESNNPGVLRWQFDPEKCFDFWLEKGRDCSNCIAACPAASRLADLIS